MSEGLSRKIVNDLKKVGFPTEVAVSSFLDRVGWTVYNGALFEDLDENKPREIDVHAVNVNNSLADKIKVKIEPGNENKLISHLVIEVKRSDKPWVFFDNGRIRWPWISPPRNFKSEKERFHYFLINDLKKYGLKKYRYMKDKLHKSYHVALSSPSQPSMIYEALVKVSKALVYFKSHYGTGTYVLHLFIPIVVLDGSLWSASLDNKENVRLKEVDYLLVTHSELLEYKKLRMKFEEEQIVEIITKKAFEKRFKIIEKDNKEIYKVWTNFLIQEKPRLSTAAKLSTVV